LNILGNGLLRVLTFPFLLIQIFLDPKERNNTEYKLETFTAVYRRLCGKDVAFEYPMSETA
jgi:small subunit ribosomal protein S7e